MNVSHSMKKYNCDLVNKKNTATQKQNLAMGHYIHLTANPERHFLNGCLRHCRGIIAGAPAQRTSFYVTLDGRPDYKQNDGQFRSAH